MRSREEIEKEIYSMANSVDRAMLRAVAEILLDIRELLTLPKDGVKLDIEMPAEIKSIEQITVLKVDDKLWDGEKFYSPTH